MAEKRTQILTTTELNSRGYRVMPSALDWGRYKRNPVLLWNKKTGEHYGLAVGRVENIRLEGTRHVGDLVFDPTEEGREAQMKWDAGSINAVSIFGPADIVERNGKRYAKTFEVWEISLVYVPADPGAVAVRDKKQGLCAIEWCPTVERTIEALSAEDNSFIDKIENEMTDENKTVEGLSADESKQIAELAAASDKSLLDKFLRLIGKTRKEVGLAADEQVAHNEALASEGAAGDTCGALASEKSGEEREKTSELPENENKKPAALNAGEPEVKEEHAKEPEKLDAGEPEEKETKPEELAANIDKARIFDKPITKVKDANMSTKPFAEYINSAENQGKIAAVEGLSAWDSTSEGGVKRIKTAELSDFQKNAIHELAATMANDPQAMNAIKNVTFAVNDGPKVKVCDTIQQLASGYLANQYLENPDLARIRLASLFVQQLFPNDDWTTGIRRVSVRESAGTIWVESAINPEIYYGNRAPVNAKNYMYDDNPRALSRKVFAIQPTVWQPINTDILGYNDRATGMAEQMRILSFSIHQYWLQILAESVPANSRIATSGTATPATNRFPINPAAAGNVNYMTVNDFWALNELFINQNLRIGVNDGRLLMTGFYLTGLQQDEAFQSILTSQLGGRTPNSFNYGPFEAITRSIIAAYDTSTNAIVDAEKYYDKPVEDVTGAIDDTHVPPVLNATTYDIALGFVPSEFIVGVGNTHIHSVSDPNDYGWKVSVCTATGAAPLRSSGVGLVMMTPGT